MTNRIAVLALLAATACAGDAAGLEPDGGVAGCQMQISVAPSAPAVGDTVDVDGDALTENLGGFERYTFSVTRAGTAVTLSERSPFDGSKVSFVADQPGPYRIELRGEVGAVSCTDDAITINAVDPGAAVAAFRFRFTTGFATPAPAQEKVLVVPGGADYELGLIGLDMGRSFLGLVRDSEGDPVVGYMRFTSTATGSVVEAFASPAGDYTVRLLSGTHDLLVVPQQQGTAAPAFFAGLAASTLDLITLPAGAPVTGTVVDGAGQPVVGAAVSMRIDGVPSTVGSTDVTGAFSVTGQLGGATALTVAPPAGSGLPRLELPASAGLVAADGVPLAIAYAAAGTSRSLALPLTAADGATPLAGASATFVMRSLAAAGTVSADGTDFAAAGALRLTADTDSAGQIAVALPEAGYDVIVRPPDGSGESVRLIAGLDLAAGQPTPASLAVAPAATLSGRVAGSAPVVGARVTASPRAVLASEPTAAATAVTGADGSYRVPVVGGAAYDVTIEPRSGYARAFVVDVTAPAPGQELDLGDVPLAPAIRVRGNVAISGVVDRSGITVQVFCGDCTGTAALAPLAEAVTDTDGAFSVLLPDPEDGS